MREWDYSDIIYDEMRDKYNNNNVKLNSDWTIDTDWEKGKEVKDEEKNTNEKAMSVVDIQPIPVDVMKSIENFTNEIKDIPEDIAKYMKAIFYSTLITMGAITYAQADTLKVQVSDNKALTVHNVYYDKEYDFPTSMVNQVCDVNGNHNEKIDTEKEEDCVYNTEENYRKKYEKTQGELTKTNYLIAGTFQTDTEKNKERADELRKDIQKLKIKLAKLKKDNKELTNRDKELTENIKRLEAEIKAKEEILKSIQFFA